MQNSNQNSHPLRIWNALKKIEVVQPSVTFREVAQTIRPESAKIKPLGTRDIFDNGIQIDNLVLNYKFTGQLPLLSSAQKIRHKITYIILVSKTAEYSFHFPQFSDLLYESPVDLAVHIYQESKFVGQTGAYPERTSKKLEKGNYRLNVQLRHQNDSLLEKFKDLPCEIRWKLASPITLEGYHTHEEAFKGEGKKITKLNMRGGRQIRCFFAPIPEDK